MAQSIPHPRIFPVQMFEEMILPEWRTKALQNGHSETLWVEGFKVVVSSDGTYKIILQDEKGKDIIDG